MIEIVSGDDQSAILNYFASIKDSDSDTETYSFTGFSKNKENLIDLIYSTNLFSTKKNIIVKINANEAPEFDTQVVLQSKSVNLYLWGSINMRFNFFKNLKKMVVFKSFEIKHSNMSFEICDSIFLNRNKKVALQILNTFDNVEDEFYGLISLMQTYLRNLTVKNNQNKYWGSLSPFFKRKFELCQQKFSDSELKNLYIRLIDLDKMSKSSSRLRKSLLQDFVIYSI